MAKAATWTNTDAEVRKRGEQTGLSWTDTDTEVRKRGEQTGLDTLVVHALNNEC